MHPLIKELREEDMNKLRIQAAKKSKEVLTAYEKVLASTPLELHLDRGVKIFQILRIGEKENLRAYRKGQKYFYTDKDGGESLNKESLQRYRTVTVLITYWNDVQDYIGKRGRIKMPERMFLKFAELSLKLKNNGFKEGSYWAIYKNNRQEGVTFFTEEMLKDFFEIKVDYQQRLKIESPIFYAPNKIYWYGVEKNYLKKHFYDWFGGGLS